MPWGSTRTSVWRISPGHRIKHDNCIAGIQEQSVQRCKACTKLCQEDALSM
jgi:ferredoxin